MRNGYHFPYEEKNERDSLAICSGHETSFTEVCQNKEISIFFFLFVKFTVYPLTGSSDRGSLNVYQVKQDGQRLCHKTSMSSVVKNNVKTWIFQ